MTTPSLATTPPPPANLRLWDAEPVDEFDLEAFNAGDYSKVRSPRQPLHGTVLADFRLSYVNGMQSLNSNLVLPAGCG